MRRDNLERVKERNKLKTKRGIQEEQHKGERERGSNEGSKTRKGR